MFNYDLISTYTVYVEVTDQEGLAYQEEMTVYVISSKVNYAPDDISLSNTVLQDNSPSGTLVGIFSASDDNPGDTHTYSFADGGEDNSSFTINNNELITAIEIDYSEQQKYTISVRATDEGNLSYDKSFNIYVLQGSTDINYLSENGNFLIYPNPMNEKAIIEFNKNMNGLKILWIMDAKGNTVCYKENIDKILLSFLFFY